MNVLLQVAALALNEIVPIEQLAARMKELFTLNPNVQVSIQNLEADALQADRDTVGIAVDFYKGKGLPLPAGLQAIVDAQSAPANSNTAAAPQS